MPLTFEERLNQILPKICSYEFLNIKGLGNEIGFWIFNYPPAREIEMRDFLTRTVLTSLNKSQPLIRAAAINLFNLVIHYFRNVNCLIMLSKCSGSKVMRLLWRLCVRFSKKTNGRKIFSMINLDNIDVLILWGTGSAYPMLRTHTLLSALHPLGRIPLLMIYPGRYDGYSLRLFNILSEGHYYRAFRLVPEEQ